MKRLSLHDVEEGDVFFLLGSAYITGYPKFTVALPYIKNGASKVDGKFQCPRVEANGDLGPSEYFSPLTKVIV